MRITINKIRPKKLFDLNILRDVKGSSILNFLICKKNKWKKINKIKAKNTILKLIVIPVITNKEENIK